MQMILSKNKFYTFILLILPVLIVISWLNVFAGNADYTPLNYALTFVLPAIVVTYIVSLLAAEYLNKQYGFSYKRVLFTLFILFDVLWLYSYLAGFLGIKTLFVTAMLPAVSTPDPREIGSKFYSFQLILAMIAIVIVYSISIVIFPEKKAEKVVEKNETKNEASARGGSALGGKTNKRRESAKKAIKKKTEQKKTKST